jgi:circadian clock protein KaiC
MFARLWISMPKWRHRSTTRGEKVKMTHEERLPTGVPGLDEVLNGGLFERRTYLLVGAAGTGKTIMGIQWLLEGTRRGERSLYLTLAETSEEIQRDVASFNWDMQSISLVDLAPTGDPAEVSSGEYHVFAPSEVEHVSVWQSIYQAVIDYKPRRVVIDSVTQLRYMSTDEYQFRRQILNLVAFLNRSGCTTLVAFEPTEHERETSVALACDGVLHLRLEISPRQIIGLRTLEVEKLRASGFLSGRHPFRIGQGGILIYPHRIEAVGSTRPGDIVLSSGIHELDTLLGGGLESATTTIVSGPTGAGKSTLAMSFLRQAVAQGKSAIFYSFEESVNSLVTRCRMVQMPIDDLIADGRLKIVSVNPMELYPDELLQLIREAVEVDGYSVVVLDSLRGYQLVMEEFGSALAHIHNIVTYLNRMGVTTMVINEAQAITGNLMATEIGVSYLADNILLLRYAEHAGQLIKVISCLKKRAGPFQAELREFRISSAGLEVSDKLEHLRGVLTGVPFQV